MSLSARRAWIEMLCHFLRFWGQMSLSARRAWIEMRVALCAARKPGVALRKESVDRNVASGCAPSANGGRSPQGERG